jgi:divalent metal cation (Fe/Co/Zn/Cd) transporter
MMMPHGWCLLWDWPLLIAHVSSDLLIGLAYYAIPIVLFRVRRALEDRFGRDALLSFALFILFCGLTHHVEILVMWLPWYWFQGIVKIVTAAFSVATAVQLARLAIATRVGARG